MITLFKLQHDKLKLKDKAATSKGFKRGKQHKQKDIQRETSPIRVSIF